MKLYNSNFSPNALRVRAVAAELGIPMEIIEVDFRKGEHKAPSYLAMNPNGKVPTLVDGDFVLWESRAINAFLASLRPECGLYPDNAKQRAVVDQWSYWGAIHLGPAIQRVAFERVMKSKFGMGEPDENAIAPQLKELDQFLPVLDASLANKEWVAGTLSLSDFALASTFVYRVPAGIALEKVPHLAAWVARIEARPAWQSAVAPLRAAMA